MTFKQLKPFLALPVGAFVVGFAVSIFIFPPIYVGKLIAFLFYNPFHPFDVVEYWTMGFSALVGLLALFLIGCLVLYSPFDDHPTLPYG